MMPSASRTTGGSVVEQTPDYASDGAGPSLLFEANGALLAVQLQRDVAIDSLRGHELTSPDHLERLSNEIRADGFLKRPIVVDARTHVILDGHHRVGALRSLGCSKTPVYFVDYLSPLIEVHPWREGEQVNKQMVLQAGLEGPKLPPKTTRHMVHALHSLSHITSIETELDVPLEELRSQRRGR